MAEVAEVVDRAFRLDAGRAVAALIGAIHDFDLAEEAWQDACEQALRIWPHRGVPDSPSAWLFTTARNRAIDRLRRDRVGRDKIAAARRFFNNAVQEYNTGIQQFPAALFASMFGFHQQTFFDLGESRPQLEQAPAVKF